ncbi:DNA/RNA non-specific endonuclease [Paeniglutamicibacter sulfureus]|uniref:DNA/RNA non-specific endonuclease n=1 Tax=Paeniglutamicibacter sulfureus TaxID=43666 RepID=UPI00345CE5BE
MHRCRANCDSFYYGNIAPQMDDFNQSSQEGIWGRLENALYEDVDVQDLRQRLCRPRLTSR